MGNGGGSSSDVLLGTVSTRFMSWMQIISYLHCNQRQESDEIKRTEHKYSGRVLLKLGWNSNH